MLEKNKQNNKILTIPNILSFLRIIFSFGIYFIREKTYIFFTMVLIIGFTDFLDGYIARKYNKQTIIGSWLDSIADFVFYISFVLYSIIFEKEVIIQLKYFVGIIILIKISSIIICLSKYKKLGFLHTIGNKITGMIIFIGLCIFLLFKIAIIIKIGLYISIIFSLEELLINIFGNKYNENVKGIYEIIKK